MPDRPALPARWVTCTTLLLCAGPVLAGGAFFAASGAEAEPVVPYERAIIAWRDGVETLIIETAVRGADREVAWVVPVPSEPTEVTTCRPNTLAVTHRFIGPQIQSGAGGASVMASMLFWGVLILCVARILRRAMPNTPPRTRVLVRILFGLMLLIVMLGHLGLVARVRFSGGAIDPIDRRVPGPCDVEVITANSGQTIQDWLANNGFDVPESAQLALDNYTRRGWSFAVVRLQTETSELIAPQPLKIVFPTPQAVCPRMLSDAGITGTQLDLYVIGRQAAALPSLQRVSCDRYYRKEGLTLWHYADDRLERWPAVYGDHYRAASIDATIGHPDVVASLGDGWTLTHLRSPQTSGVGPEDETIRWQNTEAYQQVVLSSAAARDRRCGVGMLVGAVGVLLTMAVWTRSRRNHHRRAALTAVAAAALAVAAGRLAPLSRPVVATEPTETAGNTDSTAAAIGRYLAYWQVLEQGFDGQVPGADCPAVWAAALEEDDGAFHSVSGRFQAGDRPGDYEIRPAPDGWTLTVYDWLATPIDVALGLDCRPIGETAPTTQPATP